MEITFLGAAGTVTGSRYLVRAAGRTILVDCGLFQGLKALRLRNREPLPVRPAGIDAVVLTHAHLDHSGWLPLLVRDGFRGPIHCTAATAELCGILLPDSGKLQEEEAGYANREGYSRHSPALPLYTRDDAERCLPFLRPVPVGERFEVAPGVTAEMRLAGHILGAAWVRLDDGETSVLFSGDLGRMEDPVFDPPAPPLAADYLVVESTYGDRLHEPAPPSERLAEVIERTARRGGAVLIPSFAVGRAQSLLLELARLRERGRIRGIPVYLDSPMALRATRVFRESRQFHRLSRAETEAACAVAEPVETVAESRRVDRMSYPRVVISASGMATGGRVLHHLKVFAPDPRNTVLFAGFQAAGTRGADMVGGADSVKIHGRYVPVRAEVARVEGLSAHADYAEILRWLDGFPAPPLLTFVTHGEPAASDALRRRLEERGWSARVPEHGETAVLSPPRRHGPPREEPAPEAATP